MRHGTVWEATKQGTGEGRARRYRPATPKRHAVDESDHQSNESILTRGTFQIMGYNKAQFT
jgi:hypothetical protein